MSDESGDIQINFVGDMQRLELKPGDVLVIRSPTHLSEKAKAFLNKTIESQFPGHKCLLLEDGLELGILNNAERT